MRRSAFFAAQAALVVLSCGMTPVSAQTPPDVHRCGSEPTKLDQSYYTQGRPERHQPTQSVQFKGVAKSDCGNRVPEADSKRAGNRLIQLSDLFCKLPNESETTECLMSPDVHVCGIEPWAIDERHYTSGRSKPLEPGHSSNHARVEDCCSSDVLETAVIYPSGTDFDPGIWKTDKSKRFAMLFDLYHRHWKNSSPQQVFNYLGLPDHIQDKKAKQSSNGRVQLTEIFRKIELPANAKSADTDEQQISYDLGWQKGRKTFLELSFTSGELKSLRLKQIRNSLNEVACTPWQRTNLTWDGLAKDYNRKYMVVGMPAEIVARIFPASVLSTEAVDSSGKGIVPMEVQLTPDGATVQQFRIRYETASGSSGITEWVSENLRTDERCLVTKSDYLKLRWLSLCSPYDLVLDHMGNFSRKDWKKFRAGRVAMLNSLLRSYPMIGMTRGDIYDLLGRGETEAYLQFTVAPTDSLFGDSEFYQLSSHWCGNAPVARLQIAYRDNLVCGYRIISSAFSGLGELSLSSKFEFE